MGNGSHMCLDGLNVSGWHQLWICDVCQVALHACMRVRCGGLMHVTVTATVTDTLHGKRHLMR
jgi:hypothetical protein